LTTLSVQLGGNEVLRQSWLVSVSVTTFAVEASTPAEASAPKVQVIAWFASAPRAMFVTTLAALAGVVAEMSTVPALVLLVLARFS